MSDKITTLKHDYEIPEATISVEVAFVGKKAIRKLLKKSERPTWANQQRIQEPDELLFRQKFTEQALVDIKNATYRDVKYLLEPESEFRPPKGKTWKDNFEMNDDHKKILAQESNEVFWNFLFQAAREASLYIEAQEVKEKSNLEPGSGTKPAKKD
jgi:hypothetical protein